MDLVTSFKEYVEQEKLFSPGELILLAVSGGLDSVVLCELCERAGVDFLIAHVNFQLRGEESERDEQFVRQLAERYGRKVLVKKVDTMAYVADNKCSVQVAARELRYAWFDELLGGEGRPTCVATAHHRDDNIETLLMNFFKGTGIAGLRAMLPRQGSLVRPLLFASRPKLERFAREGGLSWVEDSSNMSEKYTRNYFRHKVIPLVEEVFPAAMDNLGDNIGRFREIEQVYQQQMALQKKKLLVYAGNEVRIPVEKLKKMQPLHTLIYEIMLPYGFKATQAEAVARLLDSGSGKFVLSATHRVLKDRNWLIISPLQSRLAEHILIESREGAVYYDGKILRWSMVKASEQAGDADWQVRQLGGEDSNGRVACLDAAGIEFPLLLRKWRTGDYFYPLGMKKKKKLARFFIDNKLSLAEKERVWVLEMNKKIVWVVGKRIDDRVRVGPGSRELLVIRTEDDPAAGDAFKTGDVSIH